MNDRLDTKDGHKWGTVLEELRYQALMCTVTDLFLDLSSISVSVSRVGDVTLSCINFADCFDDPVVLGSIILMLSDFLMKISRGVSVSFAISMHSVSLKI